MKVLLAILLGSTALIGLGAERPLEAATGDVAHVMCTETFVAGRDPQALVREYFSRMPAIGQLMPLMRYDVDRARREVTVSFLGGYTRHAAFSEGRGCTVAVQAGTPAPISLGPDAGFAPDPLAAPPGPVAPGDPRIEAALREAMAPAPAGGAFLNFKAIVVVHDSRIIGERYAPGYGPQTPMLSWSAAKSPINALFGVLAREGRVDVEAPAPVAAWSDPADPRHAITLEELLRQTSGQPFGHAGNGFDRSSQMQFFYPDTAAYAESPKFDPPGAHWSYTDANYAILSGILRQQVGGTPEDVARFARRELFGPLGMTTMTMEFDEAGNPMGATYMVASARDWARFALPYLNDGVVNGRRILPEGWAAWSARPTPQSGGDYGAGFWTNRGDAPDALRRKAAGAPPDSFYADGHYDQFVLVSPAEHLVIAVFGLSQDDDQSAGLARVSHLAGAVIRALHTPAT